LKRTVWGGTVGSSSTVIEPWRRCSEFLFVVNEPSETGTVMLVEAPFCRIVIWAATSVEPNRSASVNPWLGE